jgi:hypothetical protein
MTDILLTSNGCTKCSDPESSTHNTLIVALYTGIKANAWDVVTKYKV